MGSTLRRNCQSEEYRRGLSDRFGWFGTVCSVESAMLIFAMNALSGVGPLNMTSVVLACRSSGMTPNEVRTACRELHSIGAMEFYQTVHGIVRVHFTALLDANDMLTPDEAIASMSGKSATTLKPASIGFA